MLADQLLKEVLKVGQLHSAPKHYLATLCKLLLALHINAGQADLVHGLRLLADQACVLLAEHDRVVARDLESLRDRLAALDASPLPQLSEAQVATLLEAVKTHEADSLLADYPLPFEEEGEDSGEAPAPSKRTAGARGKTPAPRGRGGRRCAETPSDSEDDDEDESDREEADATDESQEDGAAVQRAAPAAMPKRNAARAGRSTKRMVESSGSEDEVSDASETASPLPHQPQKMQRMRSTPFNRMSGVPKPKAGEGEAAAEEEEKVPVSRPTRHGAAQKRSKPGPKRSLAAAAARKASAAESEAGEETEEEGDEAASPAIKQPQKVQRMRDSPFNHGSGKPKPAADVVAGSRLGGGRRSAKNVAADSSDSEEEQESGAAAAPSDSENSEAVSGKGGVATQPSSSEVSSLRRTLRDNRI